jgi:hypothetical protein
LLEHVDKLKLREKEAPPKKGSMLLWDDESDEEVGRNKGKPDGNKKYKGKPDRNKKAKGKLKLGVDASNLAAKIDEFVNSKKAITLKTFIGSHEA